MIKKSQTRSKPKSEPKQRQGNRPRDPEVSASEVTRILAPLKAAAEERERVKKEYKERVLEAQLAALEADEQGIPLRLIVEAGLFTRQYFYQIQRDYKAGKIGNENGKAKLGAPKKKTLAEIEAEAKQSTPKKKAGNPMLARSRKKIKR